MTVPPCRNISLVKIATMSLRKCYLYILRLVHKAAIITSLYTVLIIAASPPRESSLNTFARSYYYCSCSYISSPPLHPSHTTIESADYNKGHIRILFRYLFTSTSDFSTVRSQARVQIITGLTTIESADYNKATYEYYSDIYSPPQVLSPQFARKPECKL